MNKPLFEVGEEVVVDFSGTKYAVDPSALEINGHAGEITEIEDLKSSFWYGVSPDPGLGVPIPECGLRKKHKGAGDFKEMIDELKSPQYKAEAV